MKKEQIHIIKVGGSIVENPSQLGQFLQSIAALKGNKVLVHGGGREATGLAEKMGVAVKIKEGRRITDEAMLEIVTMVYAGLVNKRIVAILQGFGCSCVGFTGADADLIRAEKRPVRNGIDYGWVGDPTNVNVSFLSKILSEGIMPVLVPLTHDGKGHLLNTNADTIATVVSVALSRKYEVHQVFAFELPGVMRDIQNPETLIREISLQTYSELKKHGVIRDGMIPKLDNAFDAIAQGVTSVRIVHYSQIGNLNNPNFDAFTTIS